MAMLSGSAPRILNVGTRRATFGATMAAVAVIAAFAFVHRSASQADISADQGWTGLLTPTTGGGGTPVEPMSSSSLVVPKTALTLPPPAAKPIVRAKSSCDSADRLCVVRPVLAIAIPPKRQVASINPQAEFLPPALIPMPGKTNHSIKPATVVAKGFSLNPLAHVPDLSAIGRPFAAAGQAVSGWIKWL